MNYSDGNFERFSADLAGQVGASDLLWLTRDALFNSITYRSSSEQKVPLRNRFGVLGYGLCWLLRERRERASVAPLAEVAEASLGFLFLEARDAHFMTLYPIFKEGGSDGVAWLADDAIRERLTEASAVQSVAGQWVHFVRLRDFFAIVRLTGKARRLVGAELGLEAQGRFAEYLIQFFAWKRFWSESLTDQCETVYTTTESAPIAKTLFAAAKERGIKRVHWCHGLRHASWQVSLATELVCNTEGDVRYFSGRVPSECKVVCRPNPRVLEIAKEVGSPKAQLAEHQPHLLFMSQGPESPYTPEMRLKDLRLLKLLVDERDALLRVRPHPRENLGLLKEALLKAGVNNYELSCEGLIEDLRWSDVVSTSWSTGLLEAQACGRECIWVNASVDQFAIVQELLNEGVGQLI